MAVTVTTVFTGTDSFIATVQATADGDTAATVTHNLNIATPAQTRVVMTPLTAVAATASPNWGVTAFAANSITLTKNTATGSGQGTPQLQVEIMRPHSIGR